MMHRPSELRKFLETWEIQPKKSLSQNFLIDGNIVSKLIDEAKVTAEDTVLEVGAGPGAITEALLATGAQIFAVEKDKKLAQALSRFQNLEVFSGDIRDFPLNELQPGTKVVANLPFHLTTIILGLLIPHHELFSHISVIVQEEMARRMCARPGTSDYSALTVFLNFYSSLHYAFSVSNQCFYPQPKTEAAVVTLRPHLPPHVDSETRFFQCVHAAFEQRRKMLRSSLKSLYPDIQNSSFAERRPETLSLQDFLALYEEMQ